MRTITLTNHPPVRIREDAWPEIAVAAHSDFDNQYEFQANRRWNSAIRVRQHADGRVIVYGTATYDTQFQNERNYTLRAGYLLAKGENIPPTINLVADDLASDAVPASLAADCIADLPPIDL